MIVLGIDIVKGNPLSRTSPPVYSIVIIDSNGKIVYESTEARLNTVIRLVWEYSVNRIGIDNIYELAPTSRDVARILSLFPSYTEVIQVTLDDTSFVDILTQASKVGIHLSSKPKPLQTAYICAILALNSIGRIIKGLERKTKIIVTRARSIGSGGSSTNRYTRGMRTAVLRAVKEIKSLLENEKIDYDVVIRRSSGGLDSAIFTVYANSKKVENVIKPYRGKDVRIMVRPIYSDIVTVNNNNDRKRPLIIGIDPGIETGLAAIDLSLNVIFMESSKSLDRVDIIDKIYHHGVPILIATDTNPPPESAKKLAAILGVQLYVPSETLDTEMKSRLMEWFKKKKHLNIKINSVHERDALVAALKAYKTYEKKLVELEKKILEMDIDIDIDEMKSLILKGYDISKVIEHVIDKHLSNMINSDIISPTYNLAKHISYCDEKIKNLESRISELVKENEILKSKLRDIRNKMEETSFERRFLSISCLDIETHQNRALSRLVEQIKQLQNTVNSLRNKVETLINEKNKYINLIVMLMSKRVIAVPILKNTSIQGINALKDIITLNKMLVIDSDTISHEVINYIKQAKLIIILGNCSHEVKQIFIDSGVPVICGIDFDRLEDKFAIISIDRIEEAIIDTISRLYAQVNSSLNLDDVIKIISEYRSNVLRNS